MHRLASIFVSHFMLDLQEAYQKVQRDIASDNAHTTHFSLSSALHFAPTLGSLGAHMDVRSTETRGLENEEE